MAALIESYDYKNCKKSLSYNFKLINTSIYITKINKKIQKIIPKYKSLPISILRFTT